MSRLEEAVRAHGLGRTHEDEQLSLCRDGDDFRIFLGRGAPDDPASCIRGSVHERDGRLHLVVRSALVGLRPDRTRAAARELLSGSLAILVFLVIVLAAGRLTGAYAASIIGRWFMFYLAVVAFRFTRWALRRRSDRAKLLSLIEGAAGPLVALPETSPFRGRSSPRVTAHAPTTAHGRT